MTLLKKAYFGHQKGKDNEEQPRKTWRRAMEKELNTIRLTWSEIRKVAQDRSRWKEIVNPLEALFC